MSVKKYLLDTNVVIKVWDEYPNLFEDIDKNDKIELKISQNIAGELSKKEFKDFKGVSVLSNRFIKLLKHIVESDTCTLEEAYSLDDNIKQGNNNNIYLSKGNKISLNDYSLIRICKNYKEYILVTEDKKMLKSAKLILDHSRVLTFNEFIDDLKKNNV